MNSLIYIIIYLKNKMLTFENFQVHATVDHILYLNKSAAEDAIISWHTQSIKQNLWQGLLNSSNLKSD